MYLPYCIVRTIFRLRIGSLLVNISSSSITTELTFLLESADSAFTVLMILPWSANENEKEKKIKYGKIKQNEREENHVGNVRI